MADGQALTEEAVQAGLLDIRLPSEAAGGGLAEVAAGAGIGLALALCLAALLRPMLHRRQRPARLPSFAERLAAAEALPEAEREIALLRLWREADPAGYAARRATLYTQDGLPEGLGERLGERQGANG
ncbi:hypothetical protein FHY55_11735 [Oceanicola sp. D3]|uniref:hypothetical protein n=1 Tax=Oceanicola sp. D3 TaxID=2587163 RepID=UPI001121EEE4|nr:hypothetical protein [Oceanicola sp. D3]QDC09877.1 hypothetical protein FHY55_11735 [Oceanicola sp. D3]